MIKRYKEGILALNIKKDGYFKEDLFKEDPDGEWVKWADVKPIIENHVEIISELGFDYNGISFSRYDWPEFIPLNEMEELIYKWKTSALSLNEAEKLIELLIEDKKSKNKSEEKKCNCAEMFNKVELKGIPPECYLSGISSWICPVHGYKKR